VKWNDSKEVAKMMAKSNDNMQGEKSEQLNPFSTQLYPI